MRLGYIILTHNKPHQLERLLSAIEGDTTHIYLHIDKRADLGIFQTEKITNTKNLELLPRFKSYWGGIGLVWATMEGLKKAVNSQCDYIFLLSGSDYPIKSKDQIESFLNINRGKNFLTHYRMPAPFWLPDKEINRIKKYHFYIRDILFEYPMHKGIKTKGRRILNSILSLFLKEERVFPKGITPYGGDQWFCINKVGAETVLNFYKHHPEVMRFLKYALIPDEIFMQTALMNSDDENIKTSIVNENLTYANWINKNNSSPAFFELKDLDKIKQSEKLIARKFDIDRFPDLLDEIDKQLLHL